MTTQMIDTLLKHLYHESVAMAVEEDLFTTTNIMVTQEEESPETPRKVIGVNIKVKWHIVISALQLNRELHNRRM